MLFSLSYLSRNVSYLAHLVGILKDSIHIYSAMNDQESLLDLSFNSPNIYEEFRNILIGKLISSKVINYNAIISILSAA